MTFSDETETHVTVTARVNELAMLQFAKSYAPDVMVLRPDGLRKKILEKLKSAVEAYEKEQ